MLLLYIASVLLCFVNVQTKQSHSAIKPQETEYFCKGNDGIISRFFPGLRYGYEVTIFKILPAGTDVRIKLDAGGAVSLDSEYVKGLARFYERDFVNNVFGFTMRRSISNFTFDVRGRSAPAHPPYIISLKIDGEEECTNPDRTYFMGHGLGILEFWPNAPDKFCGRRRVNREFTELITSGSATQYGDWPWHTAIYRNKGYTVEYICGGTLISKFLVLTAAHCVTLSGRAINPQMLGVTLGKFSLIGNEATTQDKTVYQVIVHDDFVKKNLDNDIALLKLSSEATFNNHVQPACIWVDEAYDQLDSYEITGTIVGWGIDQSDSVPNELHEAKVPLVPNLTCITYDPVFYTNILTDKKFCAGNANGTAACNGDSGGAFVVFVNDLRGSAGDYTGAWYVRGVVSVTLSRPGSSLCEPRAYTVLTDVAKYRDWIMRYM